MIRQAGIRAAGMALSAGLFLFCIAGRQADAFQTQIFDAFDTFSEITLYTTGDGDAILEECKAVIAQDDQLYSPTKEESDISKLNRAAGIGSPVEINPKTAALLEESKKAYRATNGFFDISIGALSALWGIGTEHARIPAQSELSEALHLTGTDTVEINLEQNTAMLPKAGQKLDLGGIAKGAATEDLIALLRQERVSSALINLGGNVYALGTRPGGEAWQVGIQDPSNADAILGTLSIYNKAVITSGSYQRYFEADGTRYHHILNPYTGMPSKSGLTSVTIVGDDPSEADMLSTACFLLGYQASTALLREFDAEAIFVTDDQTVLYSDSLAPYFTYDNENYTYQILPE